MRIRAIYAADTWRMIPGRSLLNNSVAVGTRCAAPMSAESLRHHVRWRARAATRPLVPGPSRILSSSMSRPSLPGSVPLLGAAFAPRARLGWPAALLSLRHTATLATHAPVYDLAGVYPSRPAGASPYVLLSRVVTLSNHSQQRRTVSSCN